MADEGDVFKSGPMRGCLGGVLFGIAYFVLSLVAIIGFHSPRIPTIVVLGVITVIAAMTYAIRTGLRERRRIRDAEKAAEQRKRRRSDDS